MILNRDCYKTILDRLAYFPAALLLGPRQIGKTTLAHQIAGSRPSVYLDLQDAGQRRQLADPNRYLNAHFDKLVILDEVHRVPNLFDSLRGSIDRGRQQGVRSGRFLLLGSASMVLMKQSGETLAGRVAHVELPPIGAMEVCESKTEELWLRGGYPDSLLAKSDEQSMIWRKDFIRTYLERDVPELGPRIPTETLHRFWTMLAHCQGSLLNAAQLARSLSVAGKTVSRYLDLMSDLLLVRRLAPFHANVRKRLVKTPKYYLRDSGIVHALLEIPNRDALLRHPIQGNSWEGFVIENILAVVSQGALPSFYRTIVGAEIDLILEFSGFSEKWAIEIKSGFRSKPRRGFYNAIEDVQPDKAFVVYAGSERFPISDGVEAIGLLEMMQLLASRQR